MSQTAPVRQNALHFSEKEIHELFGHEAAEDETSERLQNYYLKSNVYEKVICDLPLRILVGHKGIGKSALFKVAMAEELDENKLSILIKPDDIAGLSTDTKDFLKTIQQWKANLLFIITNKIFEQIGDDPTSTKAKVYGAKFIELLRDTFADRLKSALNLSSTNKVIIEKFLREQKIYVYIDDLDRGWQGRKEDIMRISTLLNAVRDISSENRGIFFRISLRSDVYFLVRTSDESTDKIESSVIWHTWTNHEIFVLLVKRVLRFFDAPVDDNQLRAMHQAKLAYFLDSIMDERFRGRGAWTDIPMRKVLMSLIRRRPRDLVKLCTLAARKTRDRQGSKISAQDFQGIFEEYSQGRLQDTINEYSTELPDIERLLMGMRSTKKEVEKDHASVFKTDQLLNKIRQIENSGKFHFAGNRPAEAKELAGFMYKINFLTARKEQSDGTILRKYFEENRYLSNQFADFGLDWEIHPAYRWALEPIRIADIFDRLRVSSEDE